MLLVDRHVVGQERALGEEEPRDRLARDVDEPPDAEPDRGLEDVERRHQVVLEDHVRRVLRRVGDRAGVDDRVDAADDRERVSRVRQVGLDVLPGSSGSWRSNTPRARSEARTSWPAASSAETAAEPTLPFAPVTRTRMTYPRPGRLARLGLAWRYSRTTSSVSSSTEVWFVGLSSVISPCWSRLTRSQTSKTCA